MKNVLFIALALSAGSAFAGRCVQDINGKENFQTRCDVVVTSSSMQECHITRAPGRFPEDYYPRYHSHPWDRSKLTEKSSSCNTELEDCKDFAFRKLEKFSYTNLCGDYSVGESAEYSFKTLNADGSVKKEINGRFRK